MRATLLPLALAAGLAAAPCTASADAAAPDPTFSVSLTRGACFGACPAYEVTIDAAGHVVFRGQRDVYCSGEQRWQVDPQGVARLEDLVDQIGFFDLRDDYSHNIPDLPAYQVTVTRGGRTKHVRDHVGDLAGMPPAVTTLELAIDDVADTIRCIDRPHPAP
jgi:hypothetical protein